MVPSTAKRTGFEKVQIRPKGKPVVQKGVLDIDSGSDREDSKYNKLDYHGGQTKARYISNIRGKFQSIQKLMNPHVVDLDDHYDNLTGR